MAPTDMIVTDLVTHSEILIAAPIAVIWPHILDTNGWHLHQRVTPVGGPAGQVGERFQSSLPDQPDAVLLDIENVEIDPGRRRTIRISTPQEGFIGFASWVLSETDGETAVGYHVYCRHGVPAEHYDAFVAGAQQQMDLGLESLKRLVEA